MSDAKRYRIDDLRRFASALGVASGLSPARASALVGHLLWFDTAGLPSFGLATLPGWLDKVERGNVNPKAEGRIVSEHAGTAVLDGQSGLPPLLLARAAGLAGEKSRDVGVGVVRVTGMGATGPATAVAAEMAIGPQIGFILGPGPSWSLALPSGEGLPAVFDSTLAGTISPGSTPAAVSSMVAPWAVMTSDEGWLVLAVAVPALEPLSTFHERVAAAMQSRGEGAGQLLPGPWEERRRDAREHGLAVDRTAMAGLTRCAERLGIAPLADWVN